MICTTKMRCSDAKDGCEEGCTHYRDDRCVGLDDIIAMVQGVKEDAAREECTNIEIFRDLREIQSAMDTYSKRCLGY